MNRYLSLLMFSFHLATASLGQTNKAIELIEQGIKQNNIELINKALSKGVFPDQGMFEAIAQNKLNFVEFFEKKGADLNYGLNVAVRRNNIAMVTHFLNKGVRFVEKEVEALDGRVDIVMENDKSKTISYKVDNSNGIQRYLIKDENGKERLLGSLIQKGTGYLFRYKTKILKTGDPAIVRAIETNNVQMVDLLLKRGINIRIPCEVSEFVDFRDAISPISPNLAMGTIKNGGSVDYNGIYATGHDNQLFSNFCPVDFIIKPLDYAISLNVNREIIELLRQYDSLPDFTRNIELVSYTEDSPDVTNVLVETFGYGFKIYYNIICENAYNIELLYSTDSYDFKRMGEFVVPYDSIGNKKYSQGSFTRYYSNYLKDNINPINLKLKLKVNKYNIFVDNRDGEKYRTFQIGKYTIMAENFRYKAPGDCWAYDDNETNVAKYGYLYGGNTARIVAPKGWHLPSITEWEDFFSLITHQQEYSNQIEKNIFINNAISTGSGRCFNLQYGGARQFGVHKQFNWINDQATFWSSTNDNGKVHCVCFDNPFNSNWMSIRFGLYSLYSRSFGFSVRLFKDE